MTVGASFYVCSSPPADQGMIRRGLEKPIIPPGERLE